MIDLKSIFCEKMALLMEEHLASCEQCKKRTSFAGSFILKEIPFAESLLKVFAKKMKGATDGNTESRVKELNPHRM